MTKYFVHMEQYWTYEAEADSPEEAAAMIEEDGGGTRGECTGYSIDAVTSTNDPFNSEDERAPISCRGGCGKQLPASGNGECTPCLLIRIRTG